MVPRDAKSVPFFDTEGSQTFGPDKNVIKTSWEGKLFFVYLEDLAALSKRERERDGK